MEHRRYDVVIVGSGCAGIAAAAVLANHGLRVALLDENTRVGGQVLRALPWPQKLNETSPLRHYGQSLMEGLKNRPIEVYSRTRVLGIDGPLNLLVEKEGRQIFQLKPRVLLLATGARERFLPFKGWTRPGVISTGAAQILMKGSGILPARRMLVAGCGPFLLVLGSQYVRHQGQLPAVFDLHGFSEKLHLLKQGWYHRAKILEGMQCLLTLRMAGVALHQRTIVIEARGSRELESVVTARVNRKGQILSGTERLFPTDCLAVGWGYAPNLELAQVAGCELNWNREQGGWVIRVGDVLETSIAGLFAAGEITGIGGALKSITEGELAAWGILDRLGQSVDRQRVNLLKQQRHRHLAFGRAFNRLHHLPAGILQHIPDETIICRCEDVRLGDIRRSINLGYNTPGMLKAALRTGMGNCQGRTCMPVIYDLLAVLTCQHPRDIKLLSVRSPVKPVAIRSFLNIRTPNSSSPDVKHT